MKDLLYQQNAVKELTDKTIKLLNTEEKRRKLVFEAPTGAGKTVMACQTLAHLVDELQNRGDSLYQEAAFIWFAPRKLHIQSYKSLKGAFSETRKLRPVMYDELEQSEGIQPGEILFVNWESVIKENNIIVRDGENSASLYDITRRTREEFGLPIIAIIDEEHMFWSKTADKTADVLNRINPDVEIRISATPRTIPHEKVSVYRKDVIDAEMIKKEVVLNPNVDLDFSDEATLNTNLVKVALEKRNQIAEAYKELGININPLLLIQLPNDKSESMSTDDAEIAEAVKLQLKLMYDITEENGKLAIWLSNDKKNLEGLEEKDNLAQVLLFKEAIALGWDCPRAAVLLIFRKLQSNVFTIQTVGRILRMPEQKHYPKEMLNVGYVYTDIAKDQIEIITTDADYITKNAIMSYRRKDLNNVSLKAFFSERPNVERNYLGPDFKRILFQTAERLWNIPPINNLFSFEELQKVDEESGIKNKLPETGDLKINENRKRVQNFLKLDVKNINVEIPKDVHFQNKEQIIEVEQYKYARKTSEIDRVFMAYISTKGHQFESKGRTDKIASCLLDLLEEYFGLFDTDAKKVVLYHTNRPKFDKLLDVALEEYLRIRKFKKQQSKQARKLQEVVWNIPEERVYDSETNKIAEAENHALMPFVQLNEASNPEREFEKFLEENTQYIDWWYKNGDDGKQHYAIPYGDEHSKSLFYVDFIIRMKNGHIYLFDTKSKNSDILAPEKHNALLKYIEENSTEEAPLFGGIIIQDDNKTNWLYSKLPIENTNDLHGWDSFYPEIA